MKTKATQTKFNSTDSCRKVNAGIANKAFLLFAGLLLCANLYAQKTWDGGQGTSNWGDGNNWNPNGVPNNTDAVTIGNGFNVILNTNATIASLTIGAGTSGSLTIGNNNSNRTLSVTGNIIINNGGSITSAGNGGNVFNIGGNLTNNGTFDMLIGSATADVTFNGTANQTISGSGSTTDFSRITINNSSAASIIDFLPSNFTAAAGFLTLTRGIIRMSGTYTLSNTFFNTANPVINSDEGIWLNNPNVNVTAQNGDTQLSGLIRITSGTYNIGVTADWWLSYNTGAQLRIEGGALTISGALIPSSTTQTLTYNQSGGIVTLCTAGNNFSIGSFDLSAAGSSFTMSGGLIVFPLPASFYSDYRNFAGTTNVTGGSIQFGNSSSPASNLFWFEGTAPVFNLTLDATNTPTLQFLTALNVLNDITISGVLDADAFDQSISVGRNWINNGTFTAGTGTVTFNSTTQAQTIGGTVNTTFYNLTNTNTNVTGVSLLRDATVSNILNLASGSNGKFTIGANNLTIGSGGSISGAGSSRYIVTAPASAANGRLRQNNLSTAARVFPIGTPVNYLPATLTPSSAGSDFSLSVFTGTTTNGLPGGTAFGNRTNHVNAIWRADRPNGTSNAHLRFDWVTSALEGAAFSALLNPQIGIWRNMGSGWTLLPTPTTFSSDNATNFSTTVTSAVTNFGTAGTGIPILISNINILPSILKSFSVVQEYSGNRLRWEFENPDNIRKMDVEESSDGIHFKPAATFVSESVKTNTYLHITDKTVKTFYRLKFMDEGGATTYSFIVAVGGAKFYSITFLQSPVQNQLMIRHPEAKKAVYQITDMNGKILMQGSVNRNAVISTITISSLPSGTYILRYTDELIQEAQLFIR